MYRPLLQQKLFFFFFDALFIVLAFLLAFYLRLGSFARTDFPFGIYLENALLITPVWLFFLIWGGKYALTERRSFEMLRILTLSSLAGTMLFVLVFFFRREIFFSRLIVLYIFFFGVVFGMISFFLEKKFERWKVERQKDIIRVLVIGTNRAAEEMVSQLLQKNSRSVPVAILAPYGGSKKEIFGVPVLGKLDALEKIVKEQQIQEILLCDSAEQMLNLLSFAEGHFLGFRISPEILGIFRENITPEMLAGKTVLTLQASPLFGWGQFFKRLFDVIFSFLGILILSPFWLIRKIFKGFHPIFQTEKRIGAEGREFELYRSAKERSFFRDLPNMINIWRGEMSFVGPRPALPEEWQNLPSHFKRRMILRPGVFGTWQIKKLRGEKDDFEAMCQDDILYLQNWSFWNDLKIIVVSKWEILKNLFNINQI